MKLKMDLFLAREWFRAHKALGISCDWTEFLRLRREYSSDGRFYHTWQHIYECVRFVERHYGFQSFVVLALFYHDVVYAIDRKDNEEESAKVWLAYAFRKGLSKYNTDALMIADLIRMTASHRVDPEKGLLYHMMNDADMHIFLCPDHHYLDYAKNIWLEYRSFGREAYLAGRLDFLGKIDPSDMFYTHQARKLVRHARANLDLEKTILTDTPDQILV